MNFYDITIPSGRIVRASSFAWPRKTAARQRLFARNGNDFDPPSMPSTHVNLVVSGFLGLSQSASPPDIESRYDIAQFGQGTSRSQRSFPSSFPCQPIASRRRARHALVGTIKV